MASPSKNQPPKKRRKLSRAWYKKKIAQLREVGELPKRGYVKLTRNQRARIRYRDAKFGEYLGNPNAEFVRTKLTKSARKKLGGVIPQRAFRKRGVFVYKPNAESRVIITAKGELEFALGDRRSRVIRLNQRLFAQSPQAAIKQALKGVGNYQFIRLRANGRTTRADAMGLNVFLEYLKNEFWPEHGGPNNPNRKDGGLSRREFAKIFTLEVIRFDDPDYDNQNTFDQDIEDSGEQMELFPELAGTEPDGSEDFDYDNSDMNEDDPF